MEAWRQWPLGRRKTSVSEQEHRIHLTPTGLLMEGDFAQTPCLGHFGCTGLYRQRLPAGVRDQARLFFDAAYTSPPIPPSGINRAGREMTADDCGMRLESPARREYRRRVHRRCRIRPLASHTSFGT